MLAMVMMGVAGLCVLLLLPAACWPGVDLAH
jgi:hypothetical protein